MRHTNFIAKLFDDRFSCHIKNEMQYDNVILDRCDQFHN